MTYRPKCEYCGKLMTPWPEDPIAYECTNPECEINVDCCERTAKNIIKLIKQVHETFDKEYRNYMLVNNIIENIEDRWADKNED